MKPLWGAIEAGGTKFVCAVGTGPDDLRDEQRFPTATPNETLQRALGYFRAAQKKHGRLAAVGIASFGPVDLDPASPTWGFITATPKPGWTDTEVAPLFARELGMPVGFDTDVNGAVLGEHRWGAGRGCNDVVYLTVGTGIGAGVLSNGRLIHGLVHPEAGHIPLPRRTDDAFEGCCPFHGGCLEGMAAGPALERRWGAPGSALGADHPAWELEAHYLALGLQAFLTVVSPSRIILGGGVMDQPRLLPLIRQKLVELNHGYVRHPSLTAEGIGAYVAAPGLGNRAGILGALALAEAALRGK